MSDDKFNELCKLYGFAPSRDLRAMIDYATQDYQDRINTLHAMYEQAARQRDQVMDQQSAMIAAMRGRTQ